MIGVNGAQSNDRLRPWSFHLSSKREITYLFRSNEGGTIVTRL